MTAARLLDKQPIVDVSPPLSNERHIPRNRSKYLPDLLNHFSFFQPIYNFYLNFNFNRLKSGFLQFF